MDAPAKKVVAPQGQKAELASESQTDAAPADNGGRTVETQPSSTVITRAWEDEPQTWAQGGANAPKTPKRPSHAGSEAVNRKDIENAQRPA